MPITNRARASTCGRNAGRGAGVCAAQDRAQGCNPASDTGPAGGDQDVSTTRPKGTSLADDGARTVPLLLATPGQDLTIPTPEITLISLEQSASQFAQPLSELGSDSGTRSALSEAVATAVEDAQETTTIIELPTDIRTVTGTRVNMRAGPGTQHEIVSRLTLGDEVVVLSDPGTGWLRLRPLASDQVGWISASLITDPSE